MEVSRDRDVQFAVRYADGRFGHDGTNEEGHRP